MKQNTSNSAKKGARHGVGQTVAAVVMALAVTAGGVGTTALLANQPVGLTVEPSTLQWESESSATQKNNKKNETKKPAVQADAKAEAETKAESEAPASTEAKAEAAVTETKAETTPEAPAAAETPAETPAAPEQPAEAAPSDPMAGTGSFEQENHYPVFQTETDELAAEDPLSPRAQNTALDGSTDTSVGTAGVNSVEDALSEAQIKDDNGTILLTPEEIRAALDAGTLDESTIDPQCLTDENGLLSWLWQWLFGKKDDTPSPAPAYSGWRTVDGKTYYYSETTHQPVTGIQSIDNKLYYFDANGVQQSAKFGIDVSKYQANIDFDKAKKAGVEFVIIRIGYRGYSSGSLVLDPLFEQHFTNARNAGLKVGVYFFSQAVNEDEAREEAQGCWYVLNGRKLDYPIYFDTEASGGSNGRADGLGTADRTKCAIAFCEEVKALGYQPGVYASTLWYRNRVDLSQLSKYSIWNAHYNVASSPIPCQMWQGTCTARIPGYAGEIDVNISYMG